MAAGPAQPALECSNALLVLQSRIAPRLSYGTKLRRPAANMTAVLTRAAQLASGIHREASHAAVFEDSCVKQDVMLVNLDVCQVTFATVLHTPRRCTRALTRVYIPALDTDLSPIVTTYVCTTGLHGSCYLVWPAHLGHLEHGHSCVRACHETAPSHCVNPTATPKHAVQFLKRWNSG